MSKLSGAEQVLVASLEELLRKLKEGKVALSSISQDLSMDRTYVNEMGLMHTRASDYLNTAFTIKFSEYKLRHD